MDVDVAEDFMIVYQDCSSYGFHIVCTMSVADNLSGILPFSAIYTLNVIFDRLI